MLVTGCTREHLKAAASKAGVRLNNLSTHRKGFRFTLKTSGPTSDGKPVRFGRRGFRKRFCARCKGITYIGNPPKTCPHCKGSGFTRRRIPGAVCWHGHRKFMRHLFDLAPNAKLVSALATYNGRTDFETKHPETYYAKRDYMGMSVDAAAALPCDCR